MLRALLLVVCIVAVLVSVVYLFFWNRVIGALLGFGVRWLLWDWSSSAIWVDVGSLHLSLLAGRVMFRDLRYHSSNQTFRIVKCQVSWRYWLRRPAEEEDLEGMHAGEAEDTRAIPQKRSPLCRIHVSMDGFEWFMYNRTTAFEHILSQMDSSGASLNVRSRESNIHSLNASVQDRGRTNSSIGRLSSRFLRLPSFVGHVVDWSKRQLPDLDPKSLLPISLSATKGAIMLGNHSSESLLLAQFANAAGTYGIVQSRSKLDLHKQLLRIRFSGAVISCIENGDYWKPMVELGKDVQDDLAKERSDVSLKYRVFQKFWPRFRPAFVRAYQQKRKKYKSQAQSATQLLGWKGRKASVEESHIGADFSALEYAIDRKLVEAPRLELVYYADVAGFVPWDTEGTTDEETKSQSSVGLESFDIGNEDTAPEWGLDVVSYDAALHYGPWADRQRVQLQRVFFPPNFRKLFPTPRLGPGDLRICTCLKMFVELRGQTTLQVPFREASKNWQWDGLSAFPLKTKLREAASIQVKLLENSTLKYLVPMFATEAGYLAQLDVYLDRPLVSSSLNDARLVEANSCTITSCLPSPLEWNAQREWIFDISLSRATLSLFRDHINMFLDLGRDWASGPPSDFNTYVPMVYGVTLVVHDYELNMYANDHNIVDKPTSRDDNVLFTWKGAGMRSEILIPSNIFRPLSTTVSFVIDLPSLALFLTLPRWNTHSMNSTSQITDIARFPELRIDGSYKYYSEVRPDWADQLKLDIAGRMFTIKLFGWVVRHLMVLRENYFGAFTQYSTTREFLDKHFLKMPIGDPLELKYRHGKSNAFHMDLSIALEDGIIAMPAGLPGYEFFEDAESGDVGIGACALYSFPQLQILLRLYEFSMEFVINCDPLAVSVEAECADDALFEHRLSSPKEVITITGLEIGANRLFGPHPRAATYVCIWNIHCGRISGALTTLDGRTMLRTLKSFLHNYADPFNAPAKVYAVPEDRDATFLKVTVDSIDCTWSVHTVCMRILAPNGVHLDSSTLAGKTYRKSLNVLVPLVDVQVLLAGRSKRRWLEVGNINTSIVLDLYRSPAGWIQEAELQRRFLVEQDSATDRFSGVLEGEIVVSPGLGKPFNLLFMPKVLRPDLTDDRTQRSSYKLARSVDARSRNRDYFRQDTESDDEPRIPDAIRDQRLADSRPTTVVTLQDMDILGQSSSMEESDTDSLRSEETFSDVSEFNAGESNLSLEMNALGLTIHEDHEMTDANSWKQSMHYWLVGRHYRGLGISKSSKRLSEPLISTLRDNRPAFMRNTEAAFDMHPCSTIGCSISRDNVPSTDDSIDSSQMRFVASERLSIFASPLLFLAARSLSEALAIDTSSPELQVDEMILKALKTSFPKPSSSMLDVRVQLLRLQLVQTLMSMQEFSAYAASPAIDESLESEDSVQMSVIEITVQGARLFRANSVSGKSTAKVDLDRVTGVLRTIVSVLNAKSRKQLPSPVAEVSGKEFVFSSTGSKVQLSLGHSGILLRQDAPHVIAASLLDLSKRLQTFLTNDLALSGQARTRLQYLVRALLERDADQPARNMLSAIQPSFLVQAGRPADLRQNVDWRFLVHLRDAHPHKPGKDEKEDRLPPPAILQPDEAPLHRRDISALLTSRHFSWVGDSDKLPLLDVPVLRHLFDRPSKAEARSFNLFPLAGLLQCKSLTLTYDDAATSHHDTIRVFDVDVRLDVLDRILIVPVQSLSPYSMTARRASPTADITNEATLLMILRIQIRDISLSIFPSIIILMRNLIHLRRSPLLRNTSPAAAPDASDGAPSFLDKRLLNGIITLDVHLYVRRLSAEAATENVVFALTIDNINAASLCFLSRPRYIDPLSLDVSFSNTSGFEAFTVEARAVKHSDILAAISFRDGSTSLVSQNHVRQSPILRCTMRMAAMRLDVPRSVIRLYYFVEQWRQDYLPALEDMIRSLLEEIRGSAEPKAELLTPPEVRMQTHVNASIGSIAIALQVMHGTWLSWYTSDVLAYARNAATGPVSVYYYGLQLSKEKLNLTPTSLPSEARARQSGSKSSLELSLPAISLSGSYSEKLVDLVVLVDFLRVNIKPSHWDAVLSVQQKFGSDFNDLLLLISETRRKGSEEWKPRLHTQSDRKRSFTITGRLTGFRIGLEGPTSIQYLECEDIDATLTTLGKSKWHVTLSDLAAYLSPKPALKTRVQSSKHRSSVFVTTDIIVSNCPLDGSTNANSHYLEIAVMKLHAVMQPSSVGELGDFIDHLQAEILVRKERRAHELLAFKEKARKVIETFNINTRSSAFADRGKFMGDRTIKITMRLFGAAFPLAHEEGPYVFRDDGSGVESKAFLLAVKSFTFLTQRGETGQAVMNGFSFQFLSRFRQWIAEDFSGDVNQTRNRLIYPEMTARVQLETTAMSRRLFLVAGISGFILDLDPSITDYVFSLIDVYQRGMARMEQLAATLPRSTSESSAYSPFHEMSFDSQLNAITSSTMQASLKFLSGSVRLHSSSSGFMGRARTTDSLASTYSVLNEAEIFSLPEVSVWCEYRGSSVFAAPKGPSSLSEDNISLMIFKCTIHSSRNTLRPSLLPFLTEVTSNIEERMGTTTKYLSRRTSSLTQSTLSAPGPGEHKGQTRPTVASSLQLSFSLRIDRSRLELTCKPDVNVIAGLHWDSGGFVVNVSPGAQRVSVSASIGGLSVGLKHGFLSEECARLDARNLSFSVAFSKPELPSGRFVNSITVVVDTEFAGNIRFSRLQDFLCFKAVWLDHIPILNSDAVQKPPMSPGLSPEESPEESSLRPVEEQPSKQGFETAIVIRVRHVTLEADLGQSISNVKFELESARLRTRLVKDVSELTISVDRVNLDARGNLSGYWHMPDFFFQTIRRREATGHDSNERNSMLELTMTSGALDIQLQSDWLWLLQYRAEPLEAVIYDDWDVVKPGESTADRHLHLRFNVAGTKVIALMTIMAIPKLIMYAGKFMTNLEAQREGASRESTVFRETRQPRLENALSEVATAMFQTARSRLKESESFNYVIKQHMSLKLDELVFVLLPRSQGDNELARFVGKNVIAELDRTVEPHVPPADRDLRLSLYHMSISQLLKQGFDPRQSKQEFDVLTEPARQIGVVENIIFSLPAMNMRMVVNEDRLDGQKLLTYDFFSTFKRMEGRRDLDNISITFNIALYSWLTTLHKTFTRELKRAQEATDWKAGTSSPTPLLVGRITSPESAASPQSGVSSELLNIARPSTPSRERLRASERPLPSSPRINTRTTPPPTTMSSPTRSTRSMSPSSASGSVLQSVQPLPPPKSPVASGDELDANADAPGAGPSGPALDPSSLRQGDIIYKPRDRRIEKLTVRQLGEATPDLTHPFFTKKAGFNLEDALPQYVHEYATLPIEEIMSALVKIYSKQLRIGRS